MAGIRKSTLPVFRLGKTATEPSVSISEAGQIRFNKLAAQAFGDARKVMLYDWEPKSRVMTVLAYKGKLPKGWNEDDLFNLPIPTANNKNKGTYVSAATALNSPDAGIGYNFKASGNQAMSGVECNAEKGWVKFVIPEGSLTPPAKRRRVMKGKVDGKATGKVPLPPTKPAEEELELT